MKIPTNLGALVILVSVAFAAEGAEKGIEAGDLDRSVAPCNDFSAYANGSWRATKAAARTVMRMETSLAKHALDNVALRDHKSTDRVVMLGENR